MKRFWIVLLVLGLMVSVACQKKAEKTEDTPKEAAAETAEAPAKKEKPVVKSDDFWVEVVAHQVYITGKYGTEAANAKTPAEVTRVGERMNKELMAVYKKFGVDEDDQEAWAEKLQEDPTRWAAIMERVDKRAKELKGGK